MKNGDHRDPRPFEPGMSYEEFVEKLIAKREQEIQKYEKRREKKEDKA